MADTPLKKKYTVKEIIIVKSSLYKVGETVMLDDDTAEPYLEKAQIELAKPEPHTKPAA